MKQALKEQGIKLIAKEMWVWENEKQSDAKLEFVIFKSIDYNTYLIKVSSTYFRWYDRASETNPNEVKFKVGDKVRIMKQNEDKMKLWWNDMIESVGKIGTVQKVKTDRCLVGVEDDVVGWYYLNESLELVDNSPKVGDVGYFWDEGNKHRIMYGKLTNIIDVEYRYVLGKVGNDGFENFSPIPPEIK